MPTTTESAATRKLKAQVKSQGSDISALRSRISELVDDLHLLKDDVTRFKSNVAEDIKRIIEKD